MKKYHLYLGFISIVHILIISFVYIDSKIVEKPPTGIKVSLRTIRPYEKPVTLTRSILSKSKIWESFTVGKKDISKYSEIPTFQNSGEGGELGIWSKIEEGLHYPSELSDIGIRGKVIAEIYLDKSALFKDKYSKFRCSSPFLCVLIRRVLRKALSKPLELQMIKQGRYKALFEFHIGAKELTGDEVDMKRGSLHQYFFYRYQFGNDTTFDQYANTIFETIKSIQNLTNIFKYLPHQKLQRKLRIERFLKDYQSDRYWGKDV